MAQTGDAPAPAPGWHAWTRERLAVAWQPRHVTNGVTRGATPDLVLGDVSEYDPATPDTSLAAGVPIRFDEARRALVARTSIVGLPPLLLYRGAAVTAIGSDVHLLARVPGVRLEFDHRSVLELGLIGHPVEHRTLFRDLSLVPSGSLLQLGMEGTVRLENAWRLPELAPLDWPEFIEAQIGAFIEGVRRTRTDGAFLSLTAGLDTRTVFATLASQGRLLPTATMTGPKRSLDARIAGRLAEHYGAPHHPIVFDDRFIRSLPRYVETASLLSGGLASLDQAPEVYFYDQLNGAFTARLSGNLGNQVGRGGTEGVSVRGADTGILARELRSAASTLGDRHWLLDKLEQGEHEKTEFILKSEIPFTLASNFPIGNHFAVQQTPYANRRLIETLALRPLAGATNPSGSRVRMRVRDLGHRFLGEPARVSFQRTLVSRIGGFAAQCPVNWGWRAAGGVAPAGTAMGVATLFGMYARARGLDGGILKRPLAWTGLPALHDFREARTWLTQQLEEFTRETLSSAEVAGSGLFDRAALERVLDGHFKLGHDHYHTVTFALDLALAHRFTRADTPAPALAPATAMGRSV